LIVGGRPIHFAALVLRKPVRQQCVHRFLAAIRREEEGQRLAENVLILALSAIIAAR
jgi:hypothetical protein